MAERGRHVPPEFYGQPEIEPHLTWLWSVFWELGTERQLGMTIGPIPVSKIREYLRDELDLDDPECDHAKAVIRRVDDAYTAMINRRKEDGPEMADTAKATDGEGVKRIARSLGNRFVKGTTKPRTK